MVAGKGHEAAVKLLVANYGRTPLDGGTLHEAAMKLLVAKDRLRLDAAMDGGDTVGWSEQGQLRPDRCGNAVKRCERCEWRPTVGHRCGWWQERGMRRWSGPKKIRVMRYLVVL
jgi:hypothetical protein